METSPRFARRLMSSVACLLLLVALPACASDRTSQPVQGVMAFGWGANYQGTPVLDLAYVDGMTAYFSWSDLQPAKGRYDFSKVDSLVAKARRSGKVINIGVYPGSSTPQWVYVAGARTFSWVRTLKEDQAVDRGAQQNQSSPLPWDPVYLKFWKEFVTALVGRYGKDRGVGYIALTGPTIRDLSSGILLKDDADWKRFSGGRDVNQALRAAWIEVIEHYQSIDRDAPYALAIGPERPGSANVWLAEEIAHYVAGRKYTNIALLCVFLNDSWFETGLAARRIRGVLSAARQRGLHTGYQLAQSAERNRRWVGGEPIVRDLGAALDNGFGDGMDWVEIWHDDIIVRKSQRPNDRYTAAIVSAHEKLIARSRTAP